MIEFCPGRRFKPYDVANPGNVFEEYITLEIVHSAKDRSYEANDEAAKVGTGFASASSSGKRGEPQYNNRRCHVNSAATPSV